MNEEKTTIGFSIVNNLGDVTTVNRTSSDDYYITWTTQLDLFIDFLYAQGFIVSEVKLAEYLIERAEELGDLRGNSGNTVDWSEDEEDSYDFDEEFGDE